MLGHAAFGECLHQCAHVGVVPVDQPPAHERFHVAAISDRTEEVRNEHHAAWLRHLEHAARERGRNRRAQVVEQPGRVDKIELPQSDLPGEHLTDGSLDRADAELRVVARDHCEARRILIDGDEFVDLSLLHCRRQLDFAQMTGRDGQHTRRSACGDTVDRLRDELPPVAHGLG